MLLAAFDLWGIEDSIPRFAGKFAMAIRDRDRRALLLVRDRLDEKPLFYGNVVGNFLFASELKAIRQFSGFGAEINIAAVTQFLRHGYIQATASIYRGICTVRPGTMIELRECQPPREQVYWSADQVARDGLANTFTGFAEARACAMAGSAGRAAASEP